MKLSFVWWNTSLSPVCEPDRSSPEKLEVALTLIAWLEKTHDVDVVCLGEVSVQDINKLQPHLEALGYSIQDGIWDIGKTSFDTCILYKSDKLLLFNKEFLSSAKGRRTLKIGQRFDFAVNDNETIIHLFVSHWPSRLWCQENHPDRHLLGMRLRDEILKIGIEKGSEHAIVLGDFNDEPFDPSLSEHLMATRDRSLAARKPHLLYNPFWRHLGTVQPYKAGDSSHHRSGSCYYRNDDKNKWRTFDQIIFSSSFLGATPWHLREDMVKVVEFEDYTKLVLRSKMKFDHLPIIGVIEKAI